MLFGDIDVLSLQLRSYGLQTTRKTLSSLDTSKYLLPTISLFSLKNENPFKIAQICAITNCHLCNRKACLGG